VLQPLLHFKDPFSKEATMQRLMGGGGGDAVRCVATPVAF
jgi:hypothetical protein